jgi:anti-sigma regulatory factor (Ser/Thr protein kinase)
LETGCAIAFYTDGLTEVQRTPIEGERKLLQHLEATDPFSTPSPARWIRRVMLDGRVPKDDVAILVMVISEEVPRSVSRRWTLDVAEASVAQAVRIEFANELRARGMMEVDVENAEIVLGELLGNTVRYAAGLVDVIADWSGSAPVLHVLDRGPGFHHIAMLPADLYSESGRGLFIVSALTQDFRVTRRNGGGSHARAVLTLRNREIAVPASRSLAKALVGR